MRESMYVDGYLDVADERRWTPGTYLAHVLRGRAARYVRRYEAALLRALERRVARGEVARVRSAKGRVAYVRVADLPPSGAEQGAGGTARGGRRKA